MVKLSAQYINLKYGNASREDWKNLMISAIRELKDIKSAKSDIFQRYPGTHGRFQQSQLDVLDIREHKVCAIYDNAMNMLVSTKKFD